MVSGNFAHWTINIKINKGDNIQKDNLYIYIDGDNKYFIYCINDSIFNGIDIDEVSGLESTSENFVYFHILCSIYI